MLISCKKEKPTPPTITTVAASDIRFTTASSGGNVTDEGSSVVLSRGICWNISPEPTIENTKTSEYLGSGEFVSSLTELVQNTKYFIRAYATNNAGTGYGNEISFTTAAAAFPFVTTNETTSITSSSAISGGNVTADNGGDIIVRGVCWSTGNPTISDSKTNDGTGIGAFISNITGLSEGTTYNIRSYATNVAGTAYGDFETFTTLARPTLTTSTVTSVTISSAISGGNITTDGGTIVTERGICWGSLQNPTITDNKLTQGTGIGTFTCNLAGLQPNSNYYVRAYATNSIGTSYGNELDFKTYSFSDIDNNFYHSVIIGTQTWMVENLKTTHLNNGTAIPLVTNNAQWYILTTTPAYCWYNNDEVSNKMTYGALYNWYSASNANLCPIGWHVPTDAEWTTLIDHLGGSTGAASKLKETGTTHWGYLNIGATNETGFTAIPAGDRVNDGIFGNLTLGAFIWHSNELTTWGGQITSISDTPDVYIEPFSKEFGGSVRCVKD